MAMIIVMSFGSALTLMALSLLLQWRQRARRNRLIEAVRAQLEEALTLMQLTQKHRALGAQRDQVAVAQREQIARQIERGWPVWLQQFPEGVQIETEWVYMRVRTDDFAAHCRSIDSQLIVISRLERRLQVGDATESIADRCRALEDLGRLRGLSMRAANSTTNSMSCAIEFEVPLRYLCLRLSAVDPTNTAMHEAVREITDQLIEAARVSITPARCFELLTPVIDAALDDVRGTIARRSPVKNSANKTTSRTMNAAIVRQHDRARNAGYHAVAQSSF